LDAKYSLGGHNYLLDLVAVIQHGDAVNTFHWHGEAGVGMLDSLSMLLKGNYGALADVHVEKLKVIASIGNPCAWAFIWIIFLSIDTGLQNYVCSDAVRAYVGTDGRSKQPVEPGALLCYLTCLRAAMRRCVVGGMLDCGGVRSAVLEWHVFGGARLPR
jgi:hypothetical protein